jgi:hypothetical protein
MPRCCDNKAGEDAAACYASVLFLGHPNDMESDLKAIEESDLCPCVTTWCKACKTTSLITSDTVSFPSRSAHHVHYMALHKRLMGIK